MALAAGHRPCNTCRRDRLQVYLAALGAEMKVSGTGNLDGLLKVAQRGVRPDHAVTSLPDGAFVALGERDYWLKWAGALHHWAPGGYVDRVALTELKTEEVAVLTPEPSLAALQNGYSVVVHPSTG